MGERKKQLTQDDLDGIERGDLALYTIKTSADFGSSLSSYYYNKGLAMHVNHGRGGRRGGGSRNTYTRSYSIKVYQSGFAYIGAGGARGYVSKHDERKNALLEMPERPLFDLYLYIMDRCPHEILELEVSQSLKKLAEERRKRVEERQQRQSG